MPETELEARARAQRERYVEQAFMWAQQQEGMSPLAAKAALLEQVESFRLDLQQEEAEE